MAERWEELLEHRLLHEAQASAEWRIECFSREIRERCESPIEAMLAACFAKLHWVEGSDCTLSWEMDPTHDLDSFRERVRGIGDEVLSSSMLGPGTYRSWTGLIVPQIKIGDYRLDFLAGAVMCDRRQDFPTALLAIECDGHEFHERTKKQAERDKQRDRFLQTLGIAVFRFTGSQIYRDPEQCFDEITGFFSSWAEPYIDTHLRSIGIRKDAEQ